MKVNFSGTSFFNPKYVSRSDLYSVIDKNNKEPDRIALRNLDRFLVVETKSGNPIEEALKSFAMLLSMNSGIKLPLIYNYTRFDVNEKVLSDIKRQMDITG